MDAVSKHKFHGGYQCKLPDAALSRLWARMPRFPIPVGYGSTPESAYHNWRLLCRMGE
jgi:hypothetical protein